MHRKRFNLPPLDLIQGFEAAARNLSLHQGGRGAVHHAVGGQPADPGAGGAPGRHAVRAPPPHAGADRAGPHAAARRRRVAGAPAAGHRPAARPSARPPHLTVTTTSGFASLWLIPRLRGFTALHPDRRRAHLRDLQDAQPGAQPGRRGGALLQGRTRRRRAPFGCSARSCFPSAARRCWRRRRSRCARSRTSASRAAAHGRVGAAAPGSIGAHGWRRTASPT